MTRGPLISGCGRSFAYICLLSDLRIACVVGTRNQYSLRLINFNFNKRNSYINLFGGYWGYILFYVFKNKELVLNYFLNLKTHLVIFLIKNNF